MQCPNCGTDNSEGSRFCAACGQQIEGDVAREKSASKKVPILAIAIMLLASTLAVAFWHFSQRDGEEQGRTYVSQNETVGGEGSPRVLYDSEDTPSFVLGTFSTRIVNSESDALDAIADASELIGIDDVKDRLAFNRKDIIDDTTFYRFDQCYKGVPVFGRDVVVVVDKSSIPAALSGSVFVGSGIETKPRMAAEELVVESDVATYLESADLVIYPKTNDSGELCWRVATPESLFIYSAETGDLIESLDLTCYEKTNGEMRSGRAKNYDLKLDALFDDVSNVYVSEDYNRNIHVYDAMGKILSHDSNTPNGMRNELDCPLMADDDNVWERDDVAKALANVERAYDDYAKLHRVGYDGNNGCLNVFVRVGSDENNVTNACSNTAGWERDRGNGNKDRVSAFIEFNTQNSISYACTLHEYTHLVQRSICPLKMDVMGDSILEAYADVMAIAIAEDRSWSYDDNCRNIADPLDESTTEGGLHAISYVSTGDPDTSWGNESHHNSTVISHAAYLMYKSGMTFQEIRNLWHYSMYLLCQDADVFDCRWALETSAFLLGFGDEKISAIGSAFDEVGIPEEVVETTSIPGRIEHYDAENENESIIADYTGLYWKEFYQSDSDWAEPAYGVNVTAQNGAQIEFVVGKNGSDASPLYETDPIIATVVENSVSFEWSDNWGDSGTGTLVFSKDSVNVKMVETSHGPVRRSTLQTVDEGLDLPKVSATDQQSTEEMNQNAGPYTLKYDLNGLKTEGGDGDIGGVRVPGTAAEARELYGDEADVKKIGEFYYTYSSALPGTPLTALYMFGDGDEAVAEACAVEGRLGDLVDGLPEGRSISLEELAEGLRSVTGEFDAEGMLPEGVAASLPKYGLCYVDERTGSVYYADGDDWARELTILSGGGEITANHVVRISTYAGVYQ